MIEVYVRHADKCPKRDEGANYKRCKCPKWLYGDIPGKGPRSRISAKTRSWEKAEQAARKLEEGKSLPEVRKEEARVTIAAAVHEYLQSAQDCGISDDTLLKKTRTFKVTRREEQKVTKATARKLSPSLLGWSRERGYKYIEELGTRDLTQWRSTWKMEALAKHKRQGMVCGFFYFCMRQGWIKSNPMFDVSASYFALATLPIDPETDKSKRVHPHMFRDTLARDQLSNLLFPPASCLTYGSLTDL